MVVRYEVAFRNGNTESGIVDLVNSLNLLAPQIVAETFPNVRDRRRLTVTVELPTQVTEFINTSKSFFPIESQFGITGPYCPSHRSESYLQQLVPPLSQFPTPVELCSMTFR